MQCLPSSRSLCFFSTFLDYMAAPWFFPNLSLSLSVRTFHFKKRRSDRNRQESSRIISLSFKHAIWSLFVVHRSFVLVKNYTISITLQNLRLTKDTYVSSNVVTLPSFSLFFSSLISSNKYRSKLHNTLQFWWISTRTTLSISRLKIYLYKRDEAYIHTLRLFRSIFRHLTYHTSPRIL